jgi:hypothetical protein
MGGVVRRVFLIQSDRFFFLLVFAAYLFALLGVLLPVLAGEEPRIME